MCTRFSNTLPLEAVAAFFAAMADLARPPAPPKDGFVPGDDVSVVLAESKRLLSSRRWGWRKAREDDVVANARSESLADKPFFAVHADRHRCAVPADGFYERRRSEAPPWLFRLKSAPVFALAGLLNDDGELVVLTTAPNACVRRVHNRMPVILLGETLDAWLDPNRPFRALSPAFAASWPEADTAAYPPPPSPRFPVQSELF